MRKLVYFLGLLMLLLCQVVQAQELSGTILKDGKPQKNIRVWLKHNKGVAKTDKEGHFWLPLVHPSDTLVMGVSTKYDAQLLVGEHKEIIIHLEDEGFTVSGGLEEVTVTAPSTMRPGTGTSGSPIPAIPSWAGKPATCPTIANATTPFRAWLTIISAI
jgi:hypothetical protein